MPSKVIHLGPGEKRPVQVGRNFVRSMAISREYNEWFSGVKKKQLEGVTARIVKQTMRMLDATKEEDLVKLVRERDLHGIVSASTVRSKRVDEFILSKLHLSPERRVEAAKVLVGERFLTSQIAAGLARQRVPKKEFVAMAQKVIALWDGVNEERKKVILQSGFSLEKTKKQIDALARSGAKEYIPDTTLVHNLKKINSAHFLETVGPEANQVYFAVYGTVKTHMF